MGYRCIGSFVNKWMIGSNIAVNGSILEYSSAKYDVNVRHCDIQSTLENNKKINTIS